MIVPRNEVIEGHVLSVLRTLPDDSVDVVLTSPPYWGLRDYGKENTVVWGGKPDCQHSWKNTGRLKYGGGTNGEVGQHQTEKTHFSVSSAECELCGAWLGQLGLEPHPQAFIEHLVQIFHEVKRIMKPSGSCWVVINDTYYGGGGGHQYSPENQGLTAKAFRANADKEEKCGIDYAFRKQYKSNWMRPKQKMLIPERFAIAMQEDGWLLRNTLIWHKINPMPSSARDRLTNAYESIFFFTKEPQYFFDLDAIRKQYPESTLARLKRAYIGDNKVYNGNFSSEKHKNFAKRVEQGIVLGGNPGDVWSLTSESFKDAHYATFPQKLVKRILKATVPRQTCTACGKPRERIVTRVNLSGVNPSKSYEANTDWIKHGTGKSTLHTDLQIERNTVGWTDCGCGKIFQHGLVLDCFAGSGTTLLVAHKLGLDWLGIDISTKYCRMANKRLVSHGKIRLDSFLVTENGKVS